jgi:predicted nicotinamide N-methyase
MDDDNTLEAFFLNTNYVTKEFNFDNNIKINLDILDSATTDFDLTGQVVWIAAKVLCQYIQKNAPLFKDKILLELGSGTGLPGLLMSHYAKSITLTDFNKIVLELLEKNVEQNQSGNECLCKQLAWGNEEQMSQFKEHSFDYIIGADIVFWSDSIEPLLVTIDRLLKKDKNSMFVLSFQTRAKNTEAFLFKKAEELGFVIEDVPLNSFVQPGEVGIPENFNLGLNYLKLFKRKGE